jgi:cystathionine gamma-synthase
MHLETLAIHAGSMVEAGTGAVAPSIHLSTTFERDSDGAYPRGFIYSRTDNPNRQSLETCLSALEGGKAVAFASGSAASMAVFHSLNPGDHVLAPQDAYHGTLRQLKELLLRWGLIVSFVDMTDLAALERSIQKNTKLLWIETPSNPLLKIVDIRAVADMAHSSGALVACDNTWATPVLQRPLEWGADCVVHATTKYLGGHSDVSGGVVITASEDDLFQKIRLLQSTGGAVPSPFDCWLVRRGIKTLPFRVRIQSEQALRVAEFLATHPSVTAVHYPGLSLHSGHAIASRQMKAYGGMLSFQVRGGAQKAMAVAAKVKLLTRATSLGGLESLIEHRASIEGEGTRTPSDLLRVSIGLEHVEDLIEDIIQALG